MPIELNCDEVLADQKVKQAKKDKPMDGNRVKSALKSALGVEGNPDKQWGEERLRHWLGLAEVHKVPIKGKPKRWATIKA